MVRQSPTKRPPPPLDAAKLTELALAYVARFATSRAKLEAYLRRKLRERGWAGEGEPSAAEVAARCVSAGYVDDAAFARAKAGSLLRRGYGMRRVGQALDAAGIEPASRAEIEASEATERAAALTLARRRKFGPFGEGPLDRGTREKQLAAMLRAGHSMDRARALIAAPSVSAAEEWAGEAEG